ncbi:unnamed protein product [Lupinus luteus]|uniref:Uncharacterized protein n=1 Tax=Lupinus luteus TaxID=3873 RepID=A0AAV1XX28_LUPLU
MQRISDETYHYMKDLIFCPTTSSLGPAFSFKEHLRDETYHYMKDLIFCPTTSSLEPAFSFKEHLRKYKIKK